MSPFIAHVCLYQLLSVQQVNEARARVQELKAFMEQLRVERALTGMLDKGGDNPQEADPDEERTKAQIDKEKSRYKQNFDKLRELKKEIDHLKMMVEMSSKNGISPSACIERISHYVLLSSFRSFSFHVFVFLWFLPLLLGERLQKDFEQWYSSMLKQKAAMVRSEGDGGQKKAGTKKEAVELSKTAVNVGGDKQGSSSGRGVPLTGDKDADAEIMAFYKARESLMK